MDRRTFVISGLGGASVAAAGCLGSDEETTPEDDPSASGDYRDVRVMADNLTRQADNQLVENDGSVSVILKLKNIGTEPEYADVSLQMRNRDGEAIGSAYTRQHGPIPPEEIAELRFDVDESESEIGGYELVVRAGEPSDDSSAAVDDSLGDRNR